MSALHPTAQALIDATVALMRANDLQSVTIDQVLEASEISRGSLYHHFGDFPSLIDHSLIAIYRELTEASTSQVMQGYRTAADRAQFRESVRSVLMVIHGDQGPEVRKFRAWAIGRAGLRESMRQLLMCEQDRLNAAMADMLRRGQETGVIRPDLDIQATAVFLQAYNFGSVLDDVAGVKMDRLAYVDLLIDVVDRAILAPA